MQREYYVYIMTNINNTVLYTGVTGNLQARVEQHKLGNACIFTNKYKINKLIYFELFYEIEEALFREKQIKAGSRRKKLELINAHNAEWRDIS